MKRTINTDVQLLAKILANQEKIKSVLKKFDCNERNLDAPDNYMAFDLCAMYMAQIGEAVKLLSDDTVNNIHSINIKILSYFRNMIDHVYEKVNKTVLKGYIFSTISDRTMKEFKDILKNCQNEIKNNIHHKTDEPEVEYKIQRKRR